MKDDSGEKAGPSKPRGAGKSIAAPAAAREEGARVRRVRVAAIVLGQGPAQVRSQRQREVLTDFIEGAGVLDFACEAAIVRVIVDDAARRGARGCGKVHKMQPVEGPEAQVGDQEIERAVAQTRSGTDKVGAGCDPRA